MHFSVWWAHAGRRADGTLGHQTLWLQGSSHHIRTGDGSFIGKLIELSMFINIIKLYLLSISMVGTKLLVLGIYRNRNDTGLISYFEVLLF